MVAVNHVLFQYCNLTDYGRAGPWVIAVVLTELLGSVKVGKG